MKLTNDSTCQAQWVEINSDFAFILLWTYLFLAFALHIGYKSSSDLLSVFVPTDGLDFILHFTLEIFFEGLIKFSLYVHTKTDN